MLALSRGSHRVGCVKIKPYRGLNWGGFIFERGYRASRTFFKHPLKKNILELPWTAFGDTREHPGTTLNNIRECSWAFSNDHFAYDVCSIIVGRRDFLYFFCICIFERRFFCNFCRDYHHKMAQNAQNGTKKGQQHQERFQITKKKIEIDCSVRDSKKLAKKRPKNGRKWPETA